MMKMVAAACLAILAITPASAQDVLGPINPADSARVDAVNAAINAQAKNLAGRDPSQNFRGTGFAEPYVREQCAGLPRDRARYGPRHRRVVRWTKVCTQARLLR